MATLKLDHIELNEDGWGYDAYYRAVLAVDASGNDPSTVDFAAGRSVSQRTW
jgi:hypothetical protein